MPGSGDLTYAPDGDFHGSDTFTYKANDGSLDSNTATVTITVRSINEDPTVEDQERATDEDTPTSHTLVATDIDSPALSMAQWISKRQREPTPTPPPTILPAPTLSPSR